MAEQSAGEKPTQLALDEARNQPVAIGSTFEKRLELSLDGTIENTLFRHMSLVAIRGRDSAGRGGLSEESTNIP